MLAYPRSVFVASVRLPMRISRHPVLLAATLLSLSACDAYVGRGEREARQNLAHYRGWMDAKWDSADDETRVIGNTLTGRLRPGEETEVPLDISGAQAATVIAACDTQCSDLDLRVITEDGRLIDLDEDDDDEPRVRIDRGKPHKLKLRVRMTGCRSSSCSFAAVQYEHADNRSSSGTCFAVGPQGWLMTSYHVIDEATDIRIEFPDGRKATAAVVRRSEDNDLALLRADLPTPVWLPLAGAADIVVGMPAFTLGFPATSELGPEIKFAEGHVASLSGYEGETTLLQVHIPIQHGNSGGPVVSHAGRVVGIVEANLAEDDDGNPMQLANFARSARVAALLLPQELALPVQPALQGRAQAIERARKAVCRVEVN